MSAAGSFDRDFVLAERADLCGRSSFRRGSAKLVHAFDYGEQRESHNEELQDILDEVSICEYRCAGFLGCRKAGIFLTVQ